jgi:hypothetical protein
MQFLFSPIIGSLSDRYGRRPVILISALGLAADFALMALAPDLWWLAVGPHPGRHHLVELHCHLCLYGRHHAARAARPRVRPDRRRLQRRLRGGDR